MPAAPEAPPAGAVSYRNIAWSLGLSLGVLGVITYYTFEPAAFRLMLDAINPWLVGLVAVMLVVRVILGGWRISHIAHGRISVMAGIRTQLAWDFFSYVTPSTIGGGPFAAVYLSRNQRVTMGEATAVMLFSMLLDQIWAVLAILMVLGTALFLPVFPEALGTLGAWSVVLYFLGMMAWAGVFAYATLYRPELLEKASDWLFRLKWLRKFRGRVMGEMRRLREFTAYKREQPFRYFFVAFLLSAGSMLARYVLPVVIMWSVFPSLDALLAFFRSMALHLGALALPTPGGAGGFEGLYALFLGPLIARALIGPTLFTWRFLGYYLSIVIGVFLTMRQVQRTVRQRQEGPPDADAPRPAPAKEEAALPRTEPLRPTPALSPRPTPTRQPAVPQD